jgi:Fe-S cluster assembly iron-binding protein IscA
MFEVSEKAAEMIKKFLEESEGSKFIRILMTEGGWKGPYLVLALDEQKEDDQVLTEKGVTFLIAKTLFDQVKPISIDYVESALGLGYLVKSGLLKDVGGICSSICESC